MVRESTWVCQSTWDLLFEGVPDHVMCRVGCVPGGGHSLLYQVARMVGQVVAQGQRGKGAPPSSVRMVYVIRFLLLVISKQDLV